MDTIEEKNIIDELQALSSQVSIRHKSILDIMTKLDEYNARINRAVVKSVTNCGCIEIVAKKQDFESDTLEELAQNLDSHVRGNICSVCKEKLEEEIGTYIFFLSSLAETLGFDLSDTIKKELERDKILGIYTMK
jgi:predicted house-cleaning noncanonical NTP pyrophosphatase (MazG superfamily)